MEHSLGTGKVIRVKEYRPIYPNRIYLTEWFAGKYTRKDAVVE